MHAVSMVGCLEEVDVKLGTGQSDLCEAGLRTTFRRTSRRHLWPERESWEERLGSRPGAHCLGVSVAPHGWLYPTCSRDRDYDDIDDDDPFNPQARRIAAHNPPRGQLRSFCSYSSGLGSQTSLQPPAQTISNAPVSEYMYGRAPPGLPLHLPHISGLDLWITCLGPESRVGMKASEASLGAPAAMGCLVHLVTPAHPCVLEEEPTADALCLKPMGDPRAESCISPGHTAPGPCHPICCFSLGLLESSFPSLPAHTPSTLSMVCFHAHSHMHTPLVPSCRNLHTAPTPCFPLMSSLSTPRNQAVLFGGNPRYENVPLIGRGSPPPTVSGAPGQSHGCGPCWGNTDKTSANPENPMHKGRKRKQFCS